MLEFYAKDSSGISKLRLATGYLNLQKEYLQALKKFSGEIPIELLTSSPAANSFYKAGKFKKFIPGLYRLNAMEAIKQNPNLKIHEYSNGDWTYHAKGAWFYEDDQLPSATVIGSSNFSHRSNRRDTEVQLYIVPDVQNVEFKERLHLECEHLFEQSELMTKDKLKKDDQYQISWKDRLIRKVFSFAL